MSDIAIRVDGVFKKYRIGAQRERYRTLRDALAEAAVAPFLRLSSALRRNRPSTGADYTEIWALGGVSFEVKRGQVAGIIGCNGAGKSTLLKILSRITEPTAGYAEMHGRVGALLEVGTGFHQELTGRENIYLNGAILGMSRAEIECKFDEIVAFAEVPQFIDTPVKHYSSGMYLRLAFAVAAHLDPEILLVDEVLAVGDVAFQKKCLAKMGQVAREGRTVLFVSHNMAAVSALCPRVIALHNGQIWNDGSAEVISSYLNLVSSSGNGHSLQQREIPDSRMAWFTDIWFCDGHGRKISTITSGQPLTLCLEYRARGFIARPDFAFTIYDYLGQSIIYCDTAISNHLKQQAPQYQVRPSSKGVIKCVIPRVPLVEGDYWINMLIHRDGDPEDHVTGAARLRVEKGDFYGSGKVPPPGYAHVLLDHSWEISES